MSNVYNSLGVSATKDEVHSAIKNQDKGVFPGAFCKIIQDFDDPEKCIAMHADGAGTKASLAYIKYRETGDTAALFDVATDSLVMNLDDLLCIGATDNFAMSNTIGRNSHNVSGKCIAADIDGYTHIVEKLAKHGVNVIMSGGETADVGDLVSTLIIDSTFYVRMNKKDVIDCDNIAPGDVIVGLASFGQATYEDKYNAGMGSNGLTAARHLLFDNSYADKYPESYSRTLGKNDVYRGKFFLDSPLPGTNITVGDAVLSPTRTYAPIIKEILDTERKNIHGMIHCTGGGLAKCKNFGKNILYIKDNLFDMPPLFALIKENSDISQKEMYQDFNMGHRMEIYTDAKTAEKCIEIAKKYNVDAKIIGRCERNDDANKVIIENGGETFIY